ncbi:hypothetical protein I6A60_01775 [Frankia sp. AgB1.9]|uniref:hypothetical protein n=1 Tax=unclassified Frankia TaxID=2632575 RepID=UPI0019317F32|nr:MULTISPECIES: hypothetical protein [unclassified Frankia]MBL7491336.1 hypothetical protein [Frankia sp. AgW1.1]MBL7546614.1 hypothetical protein [Frankia sp. AgB1.9]MBL7622400.1 hypothetical protein [Frankia sp. AgB1.8]
MADSPGKTLQPDLVLRPITPSEAWRTALFAASLTTDVDEVRTWMAMLGLGVDLLRAGRKEAGRG